MNPSKRLGEFKFTTWWLNTLLPRLADNPFPRGSFTTGTFIVSEGFQSDMLPMNATLFRDFVDFLGHDSF